MATKVNTKFVLILGGVLLALLAGVGGLAAVAVMRSGERLINEGDRFAAEGDWRRAARRYERAVGKDRSQDEWLDKWQDALERVVPESVPEYRRSYSEHYVGILRLRAELNPTDAERQALYLAEFNRLMRAGGRPAATTLEQITTEVEARTRDLPADSPERAELLRYRGLADVDRMEVIQVDEEERGRALSDLEAAVDADPSDWRAAMGIARWHYAEVARHERNDRADLASEARTAAAERLDWLSENFGERPEVALYAYLQAQSDLLRGLPGVAERRAMLAQLEPLADDVLRVIERAPVETLEASAIRGAGERLAPVVRTDGLARLLAVADRLVEADPENAEALLVAGRLAYRLNEFDAARERFEAIAALPNKPVSLEGLLLASYRRTAVALMVDVALDRYQLAETDGERESALAEARTLRDRLAALVDVNTEDELNLRDARIALAEGDEAEAIKLLSMVKSSPGRADDPTVLLPLAVALARQGLTGEAAEQYERVIETGRGAAGVYAQLAELRVELRQYDDAIAALAQAVALDPDNERFGQRLAAISTARGGVVPGAGTDPIVAALIEARQARAAGDDDSALSVLESVSREHGSDARIVRQLVMIDMAQGERERAKERVAAALGENPENAVLRSIARQLDATDPVELQLELIAESDAPEVLKHLARYDVYRNAQRPDDAEEAFRRAESADPTNPTLIEAAFTRAIARGEEGFPDAERWAAQAAEQDIDKRGGLVYQGRLELARGNCAPAEESLRRAVEQIEFDPVTWRWLARAQACNGKMDDALESLARAYMGRPDDLSIGMDYANLLVGAGRGGEALDVLGPESGLLSFHRDNDIVLNAWLELESRFGSEETALERRRAFFEVRPGNAANTRAYIALLIERGDTEEANAALARAAELEGADELLLARLSAAVAAAAGEAARGEATLRALAEQSPDDKARLAALLALGEFQNEHVTARAAIETYEQAQAFQNDEVREADRAMGDLLFRVAESVEPAINNARTARDEGRSVITQRFGSVEEARGDGGDQAQALVTRLDAIEQQLGAMEAERTSLYTRAREAYERVLGAGEDDRVLRRLTETLVRLDLLDEADATLARLSDPDNMQAQLLAVSIAEQRGDERRAREIADDTVISNPSNPMAFLRRAMLNRGDASRRPDVIDDLNRAVELRPGMIEAWTMLIGVYADQGDPSAAFAQMRSAIDANPDNVGLRRLLVENLERAGRMDEAQREAIAVAEETDDPQWLRIAGVYAFRGGNFRESAELFERLYERAPTIENAVDYLNALLRRGGAPRRAEINPLIRAIEQQIQPSDRAPDLNMLLAQADAAVGNEDSADERVMLAYERVREAGGAALWSWFEALIRRFDDDEDRAYAFIGRPAMGDPAPPALRMLQLRRSMLGGGDAEALLADVVGLRDEVMSDPPMLAEYHRTRMGLLYQLGRYEEMAAACEAGLAIAPNDLEFRNNLAYGLAKFLGRPQEALPHAERAAQIAPLSSAVLDTLGWVYHELGRHDEAVRELTRAIDTAQSPDERVPALLHMGQARLALGQVREATDALRDARRALASATPIVEQQYGGDLEELARRVETADN